MRLPFLNTLWMTLKMHFRLTRETLQSTYARLIQCDVYTKSSGPQPNLEKELLMFLWYIGNLESVRSMADRFGTSNEGFQSVVGTLRDYA